MSILAIESQELEINVKYRRLTPSQCDDFVAKYEDLPKNEFIITTLNACIANIQSEVKPALTRLDPIQANETLTALYNRCIMLNPTLDLISFEEMSYAYDPFVVNVTENYIDRMIERENSAAENFSKKTSTAKKKSGKGFSISKAKMNSLPAFMKSRIIGQDEAIDSLYHAILRHQVGLGDSNRPIGVFLLCGPSGVGKTLMAEVLHEYLFGEEVEIVQLDCGEYQQKHENQKLLGAPAGYTGHEEGGWLHKKMEKSPSTVFLIDEVEKAHADFWHTFLKIFDKGSATDAKGNVIDFRNTIFVLTSNLGNDKISKALSGNSTGFAVLETKEERDRKVPKRDSVVRMTHDAVDDYFKIEFVNRLDEIIVFNHLSQQDFRAIADLEFKAVANKLMRNNFNLQWTPQASDLLVSSSAKTVEGARGMKKVRRKNIEDPIAKLINGSRFPKGKTFNISTEDNEFKIV